MHTLKSSIKHISLHVPGELAFMNDILSERDVSMHKTHGLMGHIASTNMIKYIVRYVVNVCIINMIISS